MFDFKNLFKKILRVKSENLKGLEKAKREKLISKEEFLLLKSKRADEEYKNFLKKKK